MLVDCAGDLYNGPQMVIEDRTTIRNCVFDGKPLIIRGKHVLVEHSEFRNSPQNGILAENAEGLIVRDNYFWNNTNVDIRVMFTLPSNVNSNTSLIGPNITNNTIVRSTPKAGIFMRATPYGNSPAVIFGARISENTIRLTDRSVNHAVGMEISNAIMPMVSNNTVMGGIIGISITRTVDAMIEGNNVRNSTSYNFESVANIRATFVGNKSFNSPKSLSASKSSTAVWQGNVSDRVGKEVECSTGSEVKGICKHTNNDTGVNSNLRGDRG